MDCVQFMKHYPDKFFDLAVVDPPYGIDINMNMGRKKGKRKMHNDKDWDATVPDEAYFLELWRVSKERIIWGGNYFDLPLTKSWLFWDKCVPEGVSFADGELAWTSFDKTLRKVKVPYSGFVGSEGNWIFHKYAKAGMRILDTHLGSQSSRIAAHKHGLDFYGAEIDKEYFEIGCKRYEESIKQATLFQTPPSSGEGSVGKKNNTLFDAA